ncbi:MAG: CRISPR-associated endonuclease Cas2 [Candidatus Pacearchaeota archaeon]
MYIIVVYDVAQERVNKVCQFLRQYLNWIQNSAFEGEVNESTLEKIKIGIKKLIKEKDSIIIFKVVSQKWIEKEIIGEEKVKITRII